MICLNSQFKCYRACARQCSIILVYNTGFYNSVETVEIQRSHSQVIYQEYAFACTLFNLCFVLFQIFQLGYMDCVQINLN